MDHRVHLQLPIADVPTVEYPDPDATVPAYPMSWDAIEPLYLYHPVKGDNPYQQDRAVGGQPSLMAAHTWMMGPFYWAPAIPAHPMRLWQPNDLKRYEAPPVPHSGSVSEPQPSQRHSRQNDIPFVNLKAPRF